MDFAIDLSNDQCVSADEASRYREYKCPRCGGSTVLRSGRLRSPHFAHRKNTADPECKDFHPSSYEWNVNGPSEGGNDKPVKQEDSIDPVQLCVIVKDASRTRLKSTLDPNWMLCVLLPSSPDGVGTMSYDLGRFPHAGIPMSRLEKGDPDDRSFPANPAAAGYEPRNVSSDTNRAFKDAVSELLPGLDQQGLTPFQCVDKRLKPRARQLQWGNRYYFVWKQDLHLEFPKSLASHLFQQYQGFSCALVDLPEFPDANTEAWLRSNCSCDFERRRNELSVLYPFLTIPNESGGMDVPLKQNFLLGAAALTGESRFPLRWVSGEEEHSHPIELSPNLRTVLEFNGEHQGAQITSIRIGGGFAGNFRLRPQRDSEQFEESFAVKLEVGTAQGKSLRFGLHASNSRNWLEQVRNGSAELIGVSFPTCALGKVSLRESVADLWKEVQQIKSPGGERRLSTNVGMFETEEVAQLQECLRQTKSYVQLSFGAFGECEFPPIAEEGGAEIDLPKELRDRMLWLCSESSLVQTTPAKAVEETVSNQGLIDLFRSVTPPASLEAHYRSVVRHLDRASVSDKLGG